MECMNNEVPTQYKTRFLQDPPTQLHNSFDFSSFSTYNSFIRSHSLPFGAISRRTKGRTAAGPAQRCGDLRSVLLSCVSYVLFETCSTRGSNNQSILRYIEGDIVSGARATGTDICLIILVRIRAMAMIIAVMTKWCWMIFYSSNFFHQRLTSMIVIATDFNLLLDDEWPLGIAFNEDARFALASSSSNTTAIHTMSTNSQEPASDPSSSSYFYPFYFSEEPLGDDVNLQPFKKGRKRIRRRIHLLPRILKNDIRRLLPQMYVNTVNSGDMTLYQRFLSEFCVGSCCMIDNLDDSSVCQTLKEMKPLTVRGLDNVSNILTKRIFSFPDVVSHIEKSWIRHQLDKPGSAVITKVKTQGTFSKENLVEMPKTVYGLPFFVIDTLRLAGQLPMFIRRLDGVTDGQNKQDANAPFYDVLMKSHLVFHVDNDNRIYRLELHGRLEVHPVSIGDPI
eukprot:scaffold760_cov178-Ochromonas_danica.AAC.9